MDKTIADQLQDLVLKQVKDAYINGDLIKTRSCIGEMSAHGFHEIDVEKVLLDAEVIVKSMPATSEYKTHPNNTHYVIHGTSTGGIEIYCKFCSNFYPATGEFMCLRITSFKPHK